MTEPSDTPVELSENTKAMIEQAVAEMIETTAECLRGTIITATRALNQQTEDFMRSMSARMAEEEDRLRNTNKLASLNLPSPGTPDQA